MLIIIGIVICYCYYYNCCILNFSNENDLGMDTIEKKVAENENDKNDLDMEQNIEIIVLDNKNYYNENINYINII